MLPFFGIFFIIYNMEYQITVVFILGVYFFVIGAIFGSFLNMLVYRVYKGENLFGRSYCDFTGKHLKIIDLIPIVSYFLFKGKCRDCHKKIPLLYPLMEFLMGVISLMVFFKVSSYINILNINLPQILINWFLIFIICFIFIFFAYYDYLHWEIDSKAVYIALVVLVILNMINFFIPLPFLGPSVENFIAGGILAGIIFLIFQLSNGGGMGEGDIYLFAFIGLSLGLVGGLLALAVTSISGSIVGVAKAVITKKKIKGLKIQLAPFIAFGFLVIFFYKDFILSLLRLNFLIF